jgi:hypothetical protein
MGGALVGTSPDAVRRFGMERTPGTRVLRFRPVCWCVPGSSDASFALACLDSWSPLRDVV